MSMLNSKDFHWQFLYSFHYSLKNDDNGYRKQAIFFKEPVTQTEMTVTGIDEGIAQPTPLTNERGDGLKLKRLKK